MVEGASKFSRAKKLATICAEGRDLFRKKNIRFRGREGSDL
jgi:hypothetical protein